MGIKRLCPSCGLASDEIRCPRCNTLKVVGCAGSCGSCGSSCKTGSAPRVPGESLPSDGALEDLDHPGTPLSR